MTEASLKEKTAKGLFWGGIGNGAMQLLNLVFGIFLARLLSTTDYGMVAVLTIFSAMAGIFSESGFILALVNKKEVKHEEYNSVFWFNISIGASLYLILFLCAPFMEPDKKKKLIKFPISTIHPSLPGWPVSNF